MPSFRSGLEAWIGNPRIADPWGNCALLCNQASVTSDFEPAWKVAHRLLGTRLKALLGPQHGFYGTAQDNMIETRHVHDEHLKIPIYSLYSETREPTPEMLDGIDTLIVDLQIVGCRIYTWKATIAACLRAAAKSGKRVIILDRPNPVGGEVLEGRVLDMDASSFVGEFPIPMRHGLTAGEAARFFNRKIKANLDVVALEGWRPQMLWADLNRPWVLTSPNLPTIDPVHVYPGLVILEGTNISEGRGTGLPFQFTGAPYINRSSDLIERVVQLLGLKTGQHPPGIFLREASFEPTSGKWMKKVCYGLQVHVVDPSKVRSFDFALALVRACIELSDGAFAWKDPPYEYDLVTLPMKLIIGSQQADQKFMGQNFSIEDPFWHEGLADFAQEAQEILIYEREHGPMA
jgi:uncharacterized protein YbbC (DUF1343 family)